MNETEARLLVENLLDRLERNGSKFTLPEGTLTVREVDAFRQLAGAKINNPAEKYNETGPESKKPPIEINVDCLSSECEEDMILCVDFGTAFSKAAVWNQDENVPSPLPIGQGISADPLLIDSVVYIHENQISFGSKAIQDFVSDSDESRAIFTSPKEILTHDYEYINGLSPSAIDPHKMFRQRDLLVFFLGFLTALTNRELVVLGIDTNVRRRFAAPGWGDAQAATGSKKFDSLSNQMRRFLAEAKILADTFELEEWLNGLDITLAKSAMDQLNNLSDEQLLRSPFIEWPILEAAAAASSVKERLLNKRPQVLVVDVGAGTTDIGAFKYVGSEDEPKFAAYRQGMTALEMAGNRLDDALKKIVREELDLGDDSTAMPRLKRELAQNVHTYKKQIFSDGKTVVAIPGLPPVVITIEQFLRHPYVTTFAAQFRKKVVAQLCVADEAGGKSFTHVSAENYVVFTGGGGGLPFLHEVFKEGLELTSGTATFTKVDLRPSWLDDVSEEVRAVFPQIAVATGGCSPDLPKQLPSVGDTSPASERSIKPTYKN